MWGSLGAFPRSFAERVLGTFARRLEGGALCRPQCFEELRRGLVGEHLPRSVDQEVRGRLGRLAPVVGVHLHELFAVGGSNRDRAFEDVDLRVGGLPRLHRDARHIAHVGVHRACHLADQVPLCDVARGGRLLDGGLCRHCESSEEADQGNDVSQHGYLLRCVFKVCQKGQITLYIIYNNSLFVNISTILFWQ